MADSSKLNENGNVVANTPYEENVMRLRKNRKLTLMRM